MAFRSYGLENRRLDMYIKSAVSQYPSTSDTVKTLKHISNHHDGTLIIVIDHR